MLNKPVNKIVVSFFNNRMGAMRLAPGAFKARYRGWDKSMGSIQDPWYATLHPRAARSRAKRAFLSSKDIKIVR